ncbi:MAG: hypothetical protein D3916_11305 [Candidatus Electrothrix sp. MAN1_4]|nr:hypothetical protein [Candidatus Electrothrix sp. MAN1_4]
MKGLLGGWLAGYEYIGFWARTVMLLIAQAIIFVVGSVVFLLIGRKGLLTYASKFDATEIPPWFQEIFDQFFGSKNTDERLINEISLSLVLGSLFALFVLIVHSEEFNFIGGLVSFVLMTGGIGLACQIPHGLLYNLRAVFEKRDVF